MEKIITDKDGNKTAVAFPTQRPKTFREIQKNIEDSNEKVKQYMPPSNKKKESPKSDTTDTKGGIRGDIFNKSSFKRSF
tara:strand:+ start:236 stop:472 length:237 start_codon:yes stop_codon:yes gene_type:complete